MYTTGKCYWILGKGKQNENIRSRNFDLLERAGHQPQTYIVFLMQLTLVVLWRKMQVCNVRNSRYKWDCTGIYEYLYFDWNIPQLPGYHHHTMNVWHFCVHSSGKIRERSLDIKLSAGTHGAVPHYFGIPRKLRPNCIMMFVDIKTGFYLNCSKCCLCKWSGFSIGYPMTRYGTLRQAIQPWWLAQIFSGDSSKFCVMQ